MYLVRIFFYICIMEKEYTFRQWLLIMKKKQVNKAMNTAYFFLSKDNSLFTKAVNDLSNAYFEYKIKSVKA
jgi:uncharacterized membrane protein